MGEVTNPIYIIMNDTQKAVMFLEDQLTHNTTEDKRHSFTPIWFTVEEIHGVIQAKCGIPALARNLRRRREQGELLSRRREGKSYMEYCYNEVVLHNTKEGLSIWQRLKEIVGME